MATNAAQNRKTVTTQHADYKKMADKWQRCRDAAAGQDAIRDGNVRYLPKLSEQDDQAYQSYLKRAVFFNATWRTICGLTGMMFRKPEIIDVPAGIKPMMDDVTMGGEPLHIFAQELAEEVFITGRVGLMIDYPAVDPEAALTVAQVQALGLRPTLQRYTAESMINWRVTTFNNASRLSMLVLTEDFYMAEDEFAGKNETRYRVLDLVGDLANSYSPPRYRMRMFRINTTTDSQEQVGSDAFPLMDGKPMTEIPFVILGTDSITPEVEAPPLIDLVDLNIAHFRVSADYEHGCHFSGLPQMVVAGYVQAEGEKLCIGSTNAWLFPDPAAHASYVEVSGNFSALQANLTSKEEQMAALGARLLAADKRMNETATTAAIHHGGETSILSAVAQVLSIGVTKALTIFAQWAGTTGPVDFAINRDFFPVPMDAPTLQALVGAWQAGAISAAVLFQNLQEGEVIDSETTFEIEQARIDNAPPQGMGKVKSPPSNPSAGSAAPSSATKGVTIP